MKKPKFVNGDHVEVWVEGALQFIGRVTDIGFNPTRYRVLRVQGDGRHFDTPWFEEAALKPVKKEGAGA